MRADQIFAGRLKQARRAAGLSQEALGHAAGIEEASASARMNQYERGVHMPKPVTIARIARALNVPVAFFFEANDDAADAILLFPKLDKHARKRILETMRALASKIDRPTS